MHKEEKKNNKKNDYYSTIRFQLHRRGGLSEHEVILKYIEGHWLWGALLKALMY